MQNLTATTPYRSGHALANSLVMALSVYITATALYMLWLLFRILTGAAAHIAADDEPLSTLDLVDLLIGLSMLSVFLVTAVLFCLWVHRAYANLAALGNPKQALKSSPAWAVGSFFIPILFLYVPYRSVRETWAKSDPAVSVDNYVAPREPPAPTHMKLWWAFWLVSNFLGYASLRVYLRAETEAGMLVSAWLELFGDLAIIPAAVFAIQVVREIDRRQEERSRRVTYVASAPPPPPLFTPQPSGPPHA